MIMPIICLILAGTIYFLIAHIKDQNNAIKALEDDYMALSAETTEILKTASQALKMAGRWKAQAMVLSNELNERILNDIE